MKKAMKALAWTWLGVALVACACGTDSTHIKRKPAIYELWLRELPAESFGNQSMLGAGEATMPEVLRALYSLAANKKAKGLFVRLSSLHGGYARADELIGALSAVRRAGKPVYCHLLEADNLAYMIAASACTRVALSPAGDLNLVGVALETVHLRALLDKVGVQADLMQVGRYKGAADPLTQYEMSPEVRSSLEAIVYSLDHHLVDSIAAARKLDKNKVREVLVKAPIDPETAKEAGLVDEVAFDDDMRFALKSVTGTKRVYRFFDQNEAGGLGVFDLLHLLTGGGAETEEHTSHVALVQLSGPIVDGEDGGQGATPSLPFIDHIRHLARNKATKAVVLRIDSPGGSALASDEMWHALRNLARSKPLIVSIGDMAASGGYYVASAGGEIFAEPTSLIGSIGVVGGKMVVADLSQKLGVNPVLLKSSEHAGWQSAFRPFSESERATLTKLINQTYERFIQRVSRGRGVSSERITPWAEGKLFVGLVAKQAGLVDQLGGLGAALAYARQKAQLKKTAPIDVWPPEPTLLDRIESMTQSPFSMSVKTPTAQFSVSSPETNALVLLAKQRSPIYAISPLWFSLK